MSRKDYIAIAAIIKKSRPGAFHHRVQGSIMTNIVDAKNRMADEIAMDLCPLFAKENDRFDRDRFDRDRFLLACGVQP